jgi:NAD(P)-dependent dehydrogenase (short-subunit alcohol dehydrogenase family)
VLNISSMAGYLSAPPYLVSKLTVRGLTVAFATELAPDRIRVNAIAPSGVGDAVSLFRGGDAQGRWRLPTELLIGVAEQPGLQVGVGSAAGNSCPSRTARAVNRWTPAARRARPMRTAKDQEWQAH